MTDASVTAVLVVLVVVLVVNVVLAIPVSVMLPLDMVTRDGELSNPAQLKADLLSLRHAGVDGVMADVWWGLVEREPQRYNWTAYLQLADLVAAVGLRLEVVTSFHTCGGNVGDECNITLPRFVFETAAGRNGVFYRDQAGDADEEYLSLGTDNKRLFRTSSPSALRTGLQLYSDFFDSFAETFGTRIRAGVIDEVQIGMGPAGELRFPSYQLSKWHYCGVGEFQSYDQFMLSDLAIAARNAGHPEWGNTGPKDPGDYNSHPNNTGFFSSTGTDNYSSDYGRFFLSWYSDLLLGHGNAVLGAAHAAFSPFNLAIAAKISGVHWWYGHPSHAAELTAGYYNANGNNGYAQLAAVFRQWNTTFDFTCLEMIDDPTGDCKSMPETLVKQANNAAFSASIPFSGENAVSFCGCGSQLELCNPTCSKEGFAQVFKQATQYHKIDRFTYLRLTRQLVEPLNLAIFSDFVAKMHAAN